MCEAFTTQDPDLENGDRIRMLCIREYVGICLAVDALLCAYGAYTQDDYYVNRKMGLQHLPDVQIRKRRKG